MLACIALGSNLANPRAQIQTAIQALQTLPKSHFLVCSRLYQSKALPKPALADTDSTSPAHEPLPDFMNAVAIIDTLLPSMDLLEALHRIETQQGRQRQRETRWGPRTLDLDIILYGNKTLKTKTLTIPHPEAHKRWFVAGPLLEAMVRWYVIAYVKGLRC